MRIHCWQWHTNGITTTTHGQLKLIDQWSRLTFVLFVILHSCVSVSLIVTQCKPPFILCIMTSSASVWQRAARFPVSAVHPIVRHWHSLYQSHNTATALCLWISDVIVVTVLNEVKVCLKQLSNRLDLDSILDFAFRPIIYLIESWITISDK